MGAKDEDAKKAGLKAKLAVEQKNSASDVGALTGATLIQAGREDCAQPVAAVAAFFANDTGTKRQRAARVSKAVGATAAHQQRVLADNSGLNKFNDPTKGTQKHVLEKFTPADEAQIIDDTTKAADIKPDTPAPQPTATANNYGKESILNVDNIGKSTLHLYDPKLGRLEPIILEQDPLFRDVVAQLQRCKKDGQSMLSSKDFEAAAKEFNKKYKNEALRIPEKIEKGPKGGFDIPVKGLNKEQVKDFLEMTAKHAHARLETKVMTNTVVPKQRK
jgi:hypothetical protein